MKLALVIPGNTQIVAPQQVQTITNNVSGFGGSLFAVAIGVLFIIGSVLALGFIVWGGIKWIMSEGDPKKITEARNVIIYAIVGLTVIFFSYLIINFFSKFLGVNLFE